MRRTPSELPFTGRTPRQPRMPDDDLGVTFAYGKHWRDERMVAMDDPDNTITPDEQKVLRQHQLEAAQARQARSDANLATALRLGEALRVLKGEG